MSPGGGCHDTVHDPRHALLHGEERSQSREVAEVEVESVAYIVCDAIGLDTGDYSFAYVARWSEGTTELVRETAERVIACAKGILQSLEVSTENETIRPAEASLLLKS